MAAASCVHLLLEMEGCCSCYCREAGGFFFGYFLMPFSLRSERQGRVEEGVAVLVYSLYIA